MSTKTRIAAATAAVFAAAGGVSLATIPSSSGTIHGCYDAAGKLKVVDDKGTGLGKCPSGWKALTWQQQGPMGPAGPPGPKGATGAQGPAGPSYVRAAFMDNKTADAWSFNDEFRTMLKVSLPAGFHHVEAKLHAYAAELPGPATDYWSDMDCRMIAKTPGGDVGLDRSMTEISDGGPERATLYMTSLHYVPAGKTHTVELQCRDDGDFVDDTSVRDVKLLATQVGGYWVTIV